MTDAGTEDTPKTPGKQGSPPVSMPQDESGGPVENPSNIAEPSQASPEPDADVEGAAASTAAQVGAGAVTRTMKTLRAASRALDVTTAASRAPDTATAPFRALDAYQQRFAGVDLYGGARMDEIARTQLEAAYPTVDTDWMKQAGWSATTSLDEAMKRMARMQIDYQQITDAFRASIAAQVLDRDIAGNFGLTRAYDAITEMVRASEPPAIYTVIDELMESMKSTSALAAGVSAAQAPLGPQLLGQQLGAFDSILPRAAERLGTAWTAGITQVAFPDTALDLWRTSKLATLDLGVLANSPATGMFTPTWDALSSHTLFTAGITECLAEATPERMFTPGMGQAFQTWQSYLEQEPTPHRLQLAAAASAGIASLLGGDLLQHPDSGIPFDDLESEFESQIVEPWKTGPAAAQADLYDQLRLLDPEIVPFLQQAWKEVENPGPAATSVVAHCVVEATDHTLRAMAPSEETTAWIHPDGRCRKNDYWDSRTDRPTRRGRIAYVLRDRPDDRAVVDGQIVVMVKTMERMQKEKHSLVLHPVAQSRMWLYTLTSALMMLVMG